MLKSKRIVMGITGASGAVYGIRLLRQFLASGCEMHVVISPSGRKVLCHEGADGLMQSGEVLREHELAELSNVDLLMRLLHPAPIGHPPHIYDPHDFSGAIASGTFPADGMVVCPCSAGTLGAIASGVNVHLIHRAAEVQLKEHRPLVLVVRESPYSLIQLKNMQEVIRAGGTILPASPAFYHHPSTIEELVDTVVGRVLDRLRIDHHIGPRWQPVAAEEDA
jgi:4-hydroxy-3-polyprenylbenzoate decarboxylase